MPQILEDLKKIKGELNQLGYPGRFELFTYENFPYNHYMMVDPDEDNGKFFQVIFMALEGRIVRLWKFGKTRQELPSIPI